MRTPLRRLSVLPSSRSRQLALATAAAAGALAVRWAVDPWLGDRHEFLPVYLAMAAAAWLGTWRAGALTAVLFYAGAESLFGAARSAADASQAHALLAGLSYWLVSACVVFGLHHAREVHDELRQRVRQLDESDHRKSNLMALLAHELRNPLSVLSTGTELIRRGKLDQRALDGAWLAVERQTAHMKRLVSDLLDTSRVEQGKLTLLRENVDLATLLTQAVADAETFTFPRRQRIQLAMVPRPGLAYLDPQRIRQVLDNLLHNAAKFSPDEALIRVSLATSTTEVTISVRDSGSGIPVAQLQTIFDSFVQLGAAPVRAQGLGLGLALCRKLVELHGGTIQARSGGSGTGAEFIVRLPRPPELGAAATTRQPVEAAPQSARPAPRGRKVLVVDDNPDGAESLATLLQLEGYQAAVAGDGRAALEAALADPPDLVFLDMRLPDMPGQQVAERLRQAPGGTALLLIGMSGMDLEGDTLPPGFSAYLVKPFEIGELRAALTVAEAAPP